MRKIVLMATAAAISVMCVNARASENLCAQPEIAKVFLEAYNKIDWTDHREAVDIDNPITINISNNVPSCHGVFELTDGRAIEGTETIYKNIAGDFVVKWKEESLSMALVESSHSSEMASQMDREVQPESFTDGVRDRVSWEQWFSTLSGERRDGAYYWAAERSKSHPDSCDRLGGEGEIGCLEAKERLTPTDIRRKSDPLYKAGWNSVQSNS